MQNGKKETEHAVHAPKSFFKTIRRKKGVKIVMSI